MENYINLSKPRGTVVVFGIPNKKLHLPLNFNDIRKKNINIVGAELGSGNDLLQMFEFADLNKV